jgi:hypothetical protein
VRWFEMDLCGAVVGKGLAAAIRIGDWDNERKDRPVARGGGQRAGGLK